MAQKSIKNKEKIPVKRFRNCNNNFPTVHFQGVSTTIILLGLLANCLSLTNKNGTPSPGVSLETFFEIRQKSGADLFSSEGEKS